MSAELVLPIAASRQSEMPPVCAGDAEGSWSDGEGSPGTAEGSGPAGSTVWAGTESERDAVREVGGGAAEGMPLSES